MNHAVKLAAAGALRRLVGYRRLRHIGRWINVSANGDGLSNSWCENGEGMVFEDIIRSNSLGDIVEVGANNGAHTVAMIDAMRRYGGGLRLIHSFEPSSANASAARQLLLRAGFESNVLLNTLACSDSEGSAALRCRDSAGGGTNSLHRTELALGPDMHIETVETTTVDRYCEATGIKQVLFLKIDTEGHDFQVLCGARKLLESRRIQYAQFEYNATWIAARKYLRDAFELLQSFDYNVGKMHQSFVEHFASWNYRLEWFEQANYVAWRNDLTPHFPVEVTSEYLAHEKPRH